MTVHDRDVADIQASWFGGSVSPDAGHWRQFGDAARPIGRNKGQIVTEIGNFRWAAPADKRRSCIRGRMPHYDTQVT
jgi:hypothetical protein